MNFQKWIFLTLLLSISACTTITHTATIAITPMPSIRPSATATEKPTLTPTPDPFTLAERIEYDIDNEIWIRIQGSMENDKPKYYKISGVKGKEINPHFYYLSLDRSWIRETKIYDKNSDIIQPEWMGDFGGWRGKSPSTQEYLISLILN